MVINVSKQRWWIYPKVAIARDPDNDLYIQVCPVSELDEANREIERLKLEGWYPTSDREGILKAAIICEREINKVLRDVLTEMAWIDNPNELKYISHPTSEYMSKAREALAKADKIRNQK